MKPVVIWATLLGACGASSPSDAPDAAPFQWKGPIGPTGGKLDTLTFAIVGDTRPAMEDDTIAYPRGIIDALWQDVEDESPRPAFGIATGDYMYASTAGNEA